MRRQSAAQPSSVSLQKQEQIRCPENGSIARFHGLGCYQVRSEKKPDSSTRAKQPNLPATNAGVRRVGEKPARSKRCLAACGRLRKLARTPAMRCQFAAQPSLPVQRPFTAPPSPVSLQKQEQTKGPQNGSIARFDGLCRYQSGSEKAPDFGTRAKQPNLPATNAGVRAASETCSQPGDALPIRRADSAACSASVCRAAIACFTAKTGANKRPRKRLHRTV